MSGVTEAEFNKALRKERLRMEAWSYIHDHGFILPLGWALQYVAAYSEARACRS